MAQRDEVYYNSIGVYVGPVWQGVFQSTGFHLVTGFTQGTTGNFTGTNSAGAFNLLNPLDRLQNLSTSYDLPKREMVQLGQMAAFAREIVDPPNIKASFNYYLTNGVNEYRLGLPIAGNIPMLSGILNNTSADFNLFQQISAEGVDAQGDINTIAQFVECLGNCYINNIGFKAAVGGVGEGSISLEGSNYVVYSGGGLNYIPSIDPELGVINQTWEFKLPEPYTGQDTLSNQPTVLKYGDITLNLTQATNIPGALINDGGGYAGCHLQSFDISIPTNLEAINELGTKYPYARRPRPPINAKIRVSAIVADMQTGNLANYISQCSNNEFNLWINMYACSGTTRANVLNYQFNGVSVDSQSFSVAVGNKKTLDLEMTCPIGSATDTQHQGYISGSHIISQYNGGPYYY